MRYPLTWRTALRLLQQGWTGRAVTQQWDSFYFLDSPKKTDTLRVGSRSLDALIDREYVVMNNSKFPKSTFRLTPRGRRAKETVRAR